jgi:hypothetical protein
MRVEIARGRIAFRCIVPNEDTSMQVVTYRLRLVIQKRVDGEGDRRLEDLIRALSLPTSLLASNLIASCAMSTA